MKKDPRITRWYRAFEKRHRQDGVWVIWHTYYTDTMNLYTIYPNVGHFMHSKMKTFKAKQYFAYHRQQKGLYFGSAPWTSASKLIQTWDDAYVVIPDKLTRYDFNGKQLS